MLPKYLYLYGEYISINLYNYVVYEYVCLTNYVHAVVYFCIYKLRVVVSIRIF